MKPAAHSTELRPRVFRALCRVLLASASAATFVASIVTVSSSDQPSAAGATTHTISWLAAGDSYSSGEGLVQTKGTCARAGLGDSQSLAWAEVASDVLLNTRVESLPDAPSLLESSPSAKTPPLLTKERFVACSGAPAAQFFETLDGNGPQWTPSDGRYDLVSFTFGGDDLGFASIVEHCLTIGCPSNRSVRRKISELGSTGVVYEGKRLPSYTTFLTHVADSAVVHGGNILVMGYPDVLENPSKWSNLTTAATCQGFNVAKAKLVRSWAADLNKTIVKAVANVNAKHPNGVHITFEDPVAGQVPGHSLGPARDLFEQTNGTNHELCSGTQPWMNGLSKHVLTRSFHPNQYGQEHLGNLAAYVIDRFKWPWSGARPTTTTTTTTTSPQPPPSTTTTTAALRPGAFVNTWTFSVPSITGGYTESGSISAGLPERLYSNLRNGNVLAGSSCSINSQTDAVLPIKVSLTNTTTGFSQTLALDVEEVAINSNETNILNNIDWEIGYNDGAQCVTGGFGQTVGVQCQSVAPEKSCTTYGFAILRDYYSPATPTGDTLLLTADTMAIAFQSSFGFAGQSATFSGPGIQKYGAEGYFDFAGDLSLQCHEDACPG